MLLLTTDTSGNNGELMIATVALLSCCLHSKGNLALLLGNRKLGSGFMACTFRPFCTILLVAHYLATAPYLTHGGGADWLCLLSSPQYLTPQAGDQSGAQVCFQTI